MNQMEGLYKNKTLKLYNYLTSEKETISKFLLIFLPSWADSQGLGTMLVPSKEGKIKVTNCDNG